MAKYNKFKTMNIFDFVLTNYGSVDQVFNFLQEAGYKSYDDFINDASNTLDINPQPNDITNYYAGKGIVVSTILPNDYAPNISYNNDLVPKTELIGDFNNDFNNDFDITSLVSTIVGYAGMNLYFTFSFTNTGNKSGEVSGTVELTGETTQNYSATIDPNTTKTITVVFPSVSVGTKTVTITGSVSDSISIVVLDAPSFEYNNDLSIDVPLPVYGGDTIDLSYSITNNGGNSGAYNSTLTIEEVGISTTNIPFTVIIDSLGTETITYSFVANTGNYVITNSEGDLINLTVG